MMSRNAKAAFYSLAGPIMRANGAIYRLLRAPRAGRVLVQLGPGQRNYLSGWINVDANMFTAKCDVWADISTSLPFPDNSIDALYSHHVIEHLPDLDGHFRELARCLKPGGVFRIGGPNGDTAIKKYIEGDSSWFSDFPDHRRSIGGRLENYIFCRREHLTILTPSFLNELATEAGLIDLKTVSPVVETSYPDYFNQAVLALEWESTPEAPHTVILEGRKPAL